MQSGNTTRSLMLGALLGATALATCGIAVADESMADDQNTSQKNQTPSLSDDLNQFEKNRGSYTNNAADGDIKKNGDSDENGKPAERSDRVQNLERDVHDYYKENDSRQNSERKAAESEPYNESEKNKALSKDLDEYYNE